MIGNFKFKDIESKNFNLICRSIKRPLLPAIRPRTLEITGTSGVYDFGDNDYSTRPLIMHIAYVGDDYTELRTRAREIAAWLDTSTWTKLIINDEPDKYYLARVSGIVDLATLKRFGEADISFECQPFAYAVDESKFTFTTAAAKDYIFDNSGTKEISFRSPQGSKFEIVITGTFTTMTLSLNGKTLTYNEAVANGTVTIDNVEMEVDLNGVNKLGVITGDMSTFLKAISGANTLSVGGVDLNISVTVNFISMWI